MVRRLMLSFENKLTIIEWLKNHEKEVKSANANKIAEVITADTGIVCNATNITSICKAANIPLKIRILKRSKNPEYRSTGSDKLIILAKAIRQLAKEFDVKLDHEDLINCIISRRNFPIRSQSSNTENSPSNHS